MKIIPLTYQLLLEILKKEISFSNGIRKYFKQYQIIQNNKIDMVVTLDAELTHHILLTSFIANKLGELDKEKEAAICYLFSNKLYSKRFQNIEVEKFVKSILKDLSKEQLQKIFDLYNATNVKADIKLDGEIKPIKYLSMRFNVPSWVVKLWGNHFGKSNSFNMMKVCHARNKQFVSFYDKNAEVDHSLFKQTAINNLYQYVGKGNVHNSKEYLSHWIYDNVPPFAEIFESVDIEPIRGIAIYANYHTPLIDELFKRFGHTVEADFIVSGISSLVDVNKAKDDKLLKGVHTYDCPYDAITTCISKQVNTFFVCPRGSSLNRLHFEPDYFLHADNSELDSLIKEETTLLDKASNLVEYSGKIFYILPTANNKESRLVIEEFLKNHPNFSLISEKQFLFSEEFDCAYYYAILEKVKDND